MFLNITFYKNTAIKLFRSLNFNSLKINKINQINKNLNHNDNDDINDKNIDIVINEKNSLYKI